MFKNRSRGFTLIELLVVVAIIGILATVAVGQYQRSIIKAREAVLKENLFTTRTSINLYFADKGRYPFELAALVDDHYLNRVPYDPIAQSSESWQIIYADIAADDIFTESGVMDLKSGAEGLSPFGGTAYADW